MTDRFSLYVCKRYRGNDYSGCAGFNDNIMGGGDVTI